MREKVKLIDIKTTTIAFKLKNINSCLLEVFCH